MVTYSLRRICGGRTATLIPQTVQWPCGFYTNRTATSPCLGCLENRTAASRSPCSGRTVTLRRPYREQPWGCRTVAPHPDPHSWIVRSPCGRRMTTTEAHKTIRFLEITFTGYTFTNRRPQNGTATVRRQHDIWPKHYLGNLTEGLAQKIFLTS